MTKDWHYLVAKALQGSQTHTGDYREAKHRSAWNAPNHQPKTSTTWGMAKASTGKQHRPLYLERPKKPSTAWGKQAQQGSRTTQATTGKQHRPHYLERHSNNTRECVPIDLT